MNTTRLTNSRFVLLLALLLGAPLLAACSTNPATGRSQLNVLSREDEISIGEEGQRELVPQYGGPVADQALQSYVREVGMKMVPHVEGDFATLPWEFTLLDSEVINAFALPGGKVFITRGLATKFNSEAELAGVLGHEIGHVTAQHANKRISTQIGFAVGMTAVTVLAGQSDDDLIAVGVPLVVGLGGQGFILKFGRDEEYESDSLGIRYMVRAGYNPMGQVRVMEVLSAASKGPRPPEIASTHPYPESRIDRAAELIERQYPETQSSASHGMFQDRYEQRMLAPLRALPPAKHRPTAAQ